MNHFLYFIPGETAAGAGQALIERAGLRYAFKGTQPTVRPNSKGPGGRQGMLLGVAGVNVDDLVCREPEQIWGDAPNGKHMVGYYADRLPGPHDLEREEFVAGHQVLLGDRRRWTVPVARCFPAGTNLPCALAMGPDGVERKVRPEYVGLCNCAEKVFAYFKAIDEALPAAREGGEVLIDEEVALDERYFLQMAVDALGVNYRMGHAEANLLGLFDTENIYRVAGALVDLPSIRAVLDAKGAPPGNPPPAPATGATAPGGQEHSPDTTRPTATSDS